MTTSFSKSSVLKMFSIRKKTKKPSFSDSSGLKSVFEKFRRFSRRISVDGRPNGRNKAAFSNSSGLASVDAAFSIYKECSFQRERKEQ